ncbi:uncharacterized protein LOC105430603 isoform X2 [Pogonomyrmex barbatus]|uniref:Uncharacterized protein LOC105430603 isoform X2 n=1 Tax=Pogonomyrmex barbatus TaxID=144034 RepID=A0A6I9WIK0_9HYME|nr:uncharacterized protein LOC105430603 isoform X2 [Pogonomyrmex barbatus]
MEFVAKKSERESYASKTHAVQEAWPQFLKGLPEFDFPRLDPLFYEHGRILYDKDDVHVEVFASNVSTIGLSNIRFMDVRSYIFNNSIRLEIDGQVSKMLFKGYVKTRGSLSILKIDGNGYFNIIANDVRMTWIINGHVVNDTLIIDCFHTAPSVAKVQLALHDFFDGNKEFSDLVVSFVNEYWLPLYRIALPPTADVWDIFLTNITNRLFSKVSFSKVFPQN